MFKNLKAISIASLVLLVIIAVYVWFASSRTPAPSVTEAKEDALGKSGLVAQSASAVNQVKGFAQATSPQSGLSSTVESPSRQLAMLYSTSKDKRKFFDEARQRPQDGGSYLARQVAIECMLFQSQGTAAVIEKKINLVPLNATDRIARLDAIKKIHEPCAGFDSAPIDNSVLKEVLAEGIKAGDPVLKIKRDLANVFAENGDLSALPLVLKSASDANNPYAVQEAISALNGNTNKHLSINGHEILPADERALMLGSSLVACQFGLDCGPTSQGALQFCTAGTSCGVSLYELVRQDGLPPNEFNRAIAFHNQLLEMFQTGNFTGISFKPKAQPTK